MQVQDLSFNTLWYVFPTGSTSADSVWTKRREARDRKRALKVNGTDAVISYVPVSFGTLTDDNHS